MARHYSRRKGKSGSKRPVKRVKPTWVTHEPHVVEQLIVKFAKAGKTTAQIGLILRDTYGISDVWAVTKKKITAIVAEHKLQKKIPEDLRALIKRDVQIMKHMEQHIHDMPSKRGMQLTESKIGRLVTYYKRNSQLPHDWAYDRSKAKTLIE
ncbi:MAG: 30S ribosomal protein S15 [Nanoarchaeota archaeon]